MTTFTMQDLTTETPEEKEAMDMIARQQAVDEKGAWNQVENTSTTETQPTTPEVIQGATGAQYTPIDMKQFEKVMTAGEVGIGKADAVANADMQTLFITLTSTIQAIIKLSLEQQQQHSQPVSPSPEGLHECVDTVLENADWFDDKLDDKLSDLVEEHDFSSDVENAVESEVDNYFSYNFSLEDHVDVYDLMRDAVDDKLEDLVQEKVQEILQEKLSNITISFN